MKKGLSLKCLGSILECGKCCCLAKRVAPAFCSSCAAGVYLINMGFAGPVILQMFADDEGRILVLFHAFHTVFRT